jgi:mRNA-degrading endonuclease RelE of RelBE toxin-antitoxin system
LIQRDDIVFEIRFTQTAVDHVRAYRKFEQKIILDGIENQLRHEPLAETRNRKRLTEDSLSDWELRIHDFRVFYDVVTQDDHEVVKIKAVGHKEHNTLFIGGTEVHL